MSRGPKYCSREVGAFSRIPNRHGPDLVARRLAERPRYVFKDPSVKDDARRNALASLKRKHARARDRTGSNRSIETPELAIALSARGRIGFRHESGLAASASLLDHDTQVTSGPGLTSSFQDLPNDRTYLRSTTAWVLVLVTLRLFCHLLHLTREVIAVLKLRHRVLARRRDGLSTNQSSCTTCRVTSSWLRSPTLTRIGAKPAGP